MNSSLTFKSIDNSSILLLRVETVKTKFDVVVSFREFKSS